MRSPRRLLALAIAAMPLLLWGDGSRPVLAARTPASLPCDASAQLRTLPTAFVPNRGQWDDPVRYVARFGAMTAWLTEGGWTLALLEPRKAELNAMRMPHERREEGPRRGAALHMSFVGGSEEAEIVAEGQLPGVHHYFLGNDASRWRSDVPLFGSVRMSGIYPGVDVRVREQDGHFEYDLLLAPGADLTQVQIRVQGADGLRIDDEGSLCIDTALGEIRQPRPNTWQVDDHGGKHAVACDFVLLGHDLFGFAVKTREPDWALVVDPRLMYSTLLGGSIRDQAVGGIALDPNGRAIVAGYTESPTFPTTQGSFSTTHGGNQLADAFITALAPSGGSLVYSTFLGGRFEDVADGFALDAEGGAVVVGYTFSTNFPTTASAFQRTFGGLNDVFVARLAPSGSSLVYSTYLGGLDRDEAEAVAVEAGGAAVVVGWTNSSVFRRLLELFSACR